MDDKGVIILALVLGIIAGSLWGWGAGILAFILTIYFQD